MAGQPNWNADCNGKVAYPSRDLALRAARRKRGRRVYKCKVCDQWHFGNVIKEFQRGMKNPHVTRRIWSLEEWA